MGTKVVPRGGDERFIGEKGAIIGARSSVNGEYVAFTGGNKHISGERVTNIKTRTVKTTSECKNCLNCLGSDPGSDPR